MKISNNIKSKLQRGLALTQAQTWELYQYVIQMEMLQGTSEDKAKKVINELLERLEIVIKEGIRDEASGEHFVSAECVIELIEDLLTDKEV